MLSLLHHCQIKRELIPKVQHLCSQPMRQKQNHHLSQIPISTWSFPHCIAPADQATQLTGSPMQWLANLLKSPWMFLESSSASKQNISRKVQTPLHLQPPLILTLCIIIRLCKSQIGTNSLMECKKNLMLKSNLETSGFARGVSSQEGPPSFQVCGK